MANPFILPERDTAMPNTPKNPFDFSDTSDLPEAIAKQLTPSTDRSVAARGWANVVIAGRDAGLNELNINQIMAAATRMQMEVPTAQTVRNYLNKAVELGYITKPGRQSYAAPARSGRSKAEDIGLSDLDLVMTADVAESIAAPAETAPVEVDTDPLAGL